ncbi:MAG TPA: histidine kinase [Virgibacillus sp.]|nr:histidine kinase [Virgibacillus sp.]
MERFLIMLKLVSIGFVSCLLMAYPPQANLVAWSVLFILIYFSLHIMTFLIKNPILRIGVLLTSITLSGLGGIHVSPYFFLLLPLSIIELISHWSYLRIPGLVIAILPMGYVPGHVKGYYVIMTIFSWMIFVLNDMITEYLEKKEKQLDTMRLTHDGLMQKITENEAFIRQSTYMFKLEERNRISQQIHDDVGHAITGALIQMEAAKKMMAVDEKRAEELLTNAIGITQDGISSIHQTLRDLKPTTEQYGINQLKLYLDEFKANHPIQTTFTYQGDLDKISHLQWKVIQENVRETFTNTLKYAEATQISVDVSVLNKLVKIAVKDNGKGREKITKGLGIVGMEERAASLHGNLIVDGTSGFSVTTLLPLHNDKKDVNGS